MDDKQDRKTSTPPDSPGALITPLTMTEEKKGVARADGRKQFFRSYAAPAAALLILITGGLWLVSYLSENPLHPDAWRNQTQVTGVQFQDPPATAPPPVPLSVDEKQETGQKKEEAEQKLADFLKIKKELDSKGAAEWGGERYERLTRLAATADIALMREEFAAAAEGYAQAIAEALGLKESMGAVLQETLDQGRRALSEGDGDKADRLFRLALLIEPSHVQALQGLQRAKNCERVMKLIQSAAGHEERNLLSAARDDYQNAVRLDPASEEAQAGLKRVTGLIASRQFDELVAGGITALHANDYERARLLLRKARSIKPDSPEVTDALAQAESAFTLMRIEELKSRAAQAERMEDWSGALAAYQSVLSLDGSVQFALQGKERALKRKEMEEAMQSYLTQPSLLETDQSLNRAAALLDEARRTEPQGPRLNKLIQDLDALVAASRTTIPVIIESDGLTDVAVYRVGKLGRFQSKELALRPGTYTVTGARSGYKDVRYSLSVKAGSASVRLTVSCNEKI